MEYILVCFEVNLVFKFINDFIYIKIGQVTVFSVLYPKLLLQDVQLSIVIIHFLLAFSSQSGFETLGCDIFCIFIFLFSYLALLIDY